MVSRAMEQAGGVWCYGAGPDLQPCDRAWHPSGGGQEKGRVCLAESPESFVLCVGPQPLSYHPPQPQRRRRKRRRKALQGNWKLWK